MKITYALLLLPLLTVTPVLAQSEDATDVLRVAVASALTEGRYADMPRSSILYDTLRAGIPGQEAARLARSLGLTPGISEDSCRRFLPDEGDRGIPGLPGQAVRGYDAIVTSSIEALTRDSAYVWVSTVGGAGRYIGSSVGHVLRRTSGEWQARAHMTSTHTPCHPKLFTAPLALAARAMVEGLGGVGPICLDPTGAHLMERDSVAVMLGAQIRGAWVPEVHRAGAGQHRDACATDETEWRRIVRFVHVDWEADDLIRVTMEGRTPGGEAIRRRYTVREEERGWRMVEEEYAERPGAGG